MISVDPTRRRTGGALLGDRIRMNAISPWSQGSRVFMRSLATRDFGSEISAALPDVVAACKVAGFDVIVVETSGIGQGDAAIVPHVDVPMYVMTPEFGAASQLEKIDMLDFAEFVAINKFDRKGASDALRDVAKQVQRNKEAWTVPTEQMPVFGTMAARFNDDGVTALYQALKKRLARLAASGWLRRTGRGWDLAWREPFTLRPQSEPAPIGADQPARVRARLRLDIQNSCPARRGRSGPPTKTAPKPPVNPLRGALRSGDPAVSRCGQGPACCGL